MGRDPFSGGDVHTRPELDRSALIVIDTQVDFLDGGANPVAGTTRVLPGIVALLRAYRSAGLPIVHVVRLYRGHDVDRCRRTAIDAGVPLVRPGSAGSQIASGLLPRDAPPLDPEGLLAGDFQRLGEQEWALWKPRWNAFHRTHLDAALRFLGVTTVVLVGCNYPNCPRGTLYGATERDYRVLIVSDAVSGIGPRDLDEARRLGGWHASTRETVDAVTAPRAVPLSRPRAAAGRLAVGVSPAAAHNESR